VSHDGSTPPPRNVSASIWSSPANQLSVATLFRALGLSTGSDVNVTSSSPLTVADMMHYVLRQATQLFSAGSSYLLTYLLTSRIAAF